MTEPTKLQNLSGMSRVRSPSKPSASTEQIQQNEIPPVELGEQSQPSERATEALQQWNNPRINIWRFFATTLGLGVMGMGDGAIGVCQYLQVQERY